LLHQHIGSLDANPNHARQEEHHGVGAGPRRLLEALEPSLLDLLDLLQEEPPALQVALQLGQRVGRDWLVLGRAQGLQAFSGRLQFRVEPADAETCQGRFDAVDNAAYLANKALVLAAGPLGILLRERRDHRHLAVVPLPAQPAEKGALEELGIEPVGLGAPVLTRHGYAGSVYDMRLDAARSQPPGQPEAIPSGFEGDGNARDLVPGLLCLLAPPLEQVQQPGLARFELLQRLALNAGYDSGYQP